MTSTRKSHATHSKATGEPRIAPLEPPYPEDLSEVLASMMPGDMEPLLLFRTLAHNERVLRRFRNGGLLDRGSIDKRDRELVILRTTARCGSEYEWGVHVAAFSAHYGLDEATVARTVLVDGAAPEWTSKDRALIRLCDELHDTSRISDSTWQDLLEHFSEEQLIELVILAGFYHTVSFATNAFQIALEDGAPRFPDAAGALDAS